MNFSLFFYFFRGLVFHCNKNDDNANGNVSHFGRSANSTAHTVRFCYQDSGHLKSTQKGLLTNFNKKEADSFSSTPWQNIDSMAKKSFWRVHGSLTQEATEIHFWGQSFHIELWRCHLWLRVSSVSWRNYWPLSLALTPGAESGRKTWTDKIPPIICCRREAFSSLFWACVSEEHSQQVFPSFETGDSIYLWLCRYIFAFPVGGVLLSCEHCSKWRISVQKGKTLQTKLIIQRRKKRKNCGSSVSSVSMQIANTASCHLTKKPRMQYPVWWIVWMDKNTQQEPHWTLLAWT